MSARERPSDRGLLARVPFVDGWPLALLLWHLAFGIALRIWRIVDATEATPGDLAWVPKTIGVDAGFAVIVWLGAGVLLSLARRRLTQIAAQLACVAASLFVLCLGAASAVSYRVSGSALTLQRLRGEDGATMRDVDLIDWSDVRPVVVLAVLSLALLIALLASVGRLERIARATRARLVIWISLGSAVCYLAYAAAWQRQDHGYGRHALGVLMESALQEMVAPPAELSAFVPPPATDEGWRALMQPEHPATPPPPPPTRAAPTTKNVIVFFSEGVSLEHTSLAPNGPPTTPLLKARAQRGGLVMNRFYSPYHRSIHALYSLLCGELPTTNELGITLLNPRIDCDEFSTAFARNGFKPGLIHGGYFSFYDKSAFLNDRDYVILEDATALGSDKWARSPWGVDDRAMVERALAWIDSLKTDDRFALVLVPITAHYPFTVPADVATPFGTTRKIDRFWNSVYFLDIVFDQLMQGLEQRGLADDTLVLFTADHGESPLEPPRVTNVDRAAYEYDVHVPAVAFSSSMFPTPQSTDRLVAIPDILPTMLDAAGATDSRVRQGTSFLSDAWQERRVFLGAARSNVHQVGFIDGHDKFLLNTRTGRMELYDLAHDSDELDDRSAREPERSARWRDTALTYADWQHARVRDWPALPNSLDVHELLADDVDVTVVDANGGRTACSKAFDGQASRRRCPGFSDDTFPGNTPVTIAKQKRRCLYVQPPPGGSVELTTSDRDYFRLVSMLQYVTPAGRQSKSVRGSIRIDVDGAAVEAKGFGKYRRVPLPVPAQSLTVTVEAPGPVCLFFSVQAWAPFARGEGRALPAAEDP